MATGNLFLGSAKNKVGDVVFYRTGGNQVSRLRVIPKNPRTDGQLANRAILKTVSRAYSMMQGITNQSFESMVGNVKNQQRFVKVNSEYMRSYSFDVDGSIIVYARAFNARNDFYPMRNPYIIAEGTLPTVASTTNGEVLNIPLGQGWTEWPTYDSLASRLGLQVGDQLTFCALVGGTEGNQIDDFVYARVILEPSNGNADSEFLNRTDESPAFPNDKNETGDVFFSYNLEEPDSSQNLVLQVRFNRGGQDTALAAVGTIASRYENGKWRRSFCQMSSAWLDGNTLGDAIESWRIASTSDRYLNQAEQGSGSV